MKKALLWQAAGLALYFVGMLLFLAVAAGVFFSPPENSIENLSATHLPLLVLSVGLIVLGRVVSWKFGGEGGVAGSIRTLQNPKPEQSKLEELGYHVPPESEGEAAEDPTSEFAYEDGDFRVVCNECGTKNEEGYSFCRNCSAELSGR